MIKPSRIARDAARQLCAAGTLRRATRTVTRLYDKRLARVGLTTTQYSILRALEQRAGPVALTRLAAEQAFERTSLYRALEPLRRDGLVKLAGDEGRRAKEVSLTARGRRLAVAALPHWQEAQAEFLENVGGAEWAGLSAQLISLVALAR